MQATRNRLLTVVAAAAAATLLAACDRPESDPTVGQRVDQGIATAEQKAGEMRSGVERAGDAIAQTAADATITAKVNAELARDDKLSALAIDVDTSEGRVVLEGSAPDTASRERAETLARAIEGVVAVENRLTVTPPRS